MLPWQVKRPSESAWERILPVTRPQVCPAQFLLLSSLVLAFREASKCSRWEGRMRRRRIGEGRRFLCFSRAQNVTRADKVWIIFDYAMYWLLSVEREKN